MIDKDVKVDGSSRLQFCSGYTTNIKVVFFFVCLFVCLFVCFYSC